jgi:cellulose synthase/poly-beta-1,6-N-acetylglucosamine synthase-like glycosyltransferase
MVAIAILTATALVLLLIAAHPFVTYPLSLWLVRWRSGPEPIDRLAKTNPVPLAERFAICMSAYNEERVIRAKIENLLAIRRHLGGLEILVYVDGASDRTAEILRDYGDQIHLIVGVERRGKTHGMNRLVSAAAAPVIVFTDANVEIEIDALEKLARYFDDPDVGCVCGHLRYINGEESATAATGSLYWRLEEHIKQLESDTGSAMGADGSIFAIRRHLHRPAPPDIIDDMFVSLSILCDGYRVVRAPDVRAYERSVVVAAEESRRKMRIACQSFNVHRLLRRRLKTLNGFDRYKYVSHKLLRWFTVFTLGASVVSGTAAAALAFGPVAVLFVVPAVGIFALGQYFKVPGLSHLADILAAFAATGAGIWLSLRGKRFQTWAPAASVRSGTGGD